jgi:hypothetical protein
MFSEDKESAITKFLYKIGADVFSSDSCLISPTISPFTDIA